MKLPFLKAGVFGFAVFCLISMTSCVTDPYGYSPYGAAYSSYTYTNYPYGYTAARLPYGYTSIYLGGVRYWHCNDHYYRHYPGRGYVVVRRPAGRPVHHQSTYGRPTSGYSRYGRQGTSVQRSSQPVSGSFDNSYQQRANHSHRGTTPVYQSPAPTQRTRTPVISPRYTTVRAPASAPSAARVPSSGSRRVKSQPTTSNSSTSPSVKSYAPTGRSTNSHRGSSGSSSRSRPGRR